MRLRPFLAALACIGFMLACGAHSDNSLPKPVTPTGNLTIRFGSDSFPGYSQVVVSLEKIEATTDGTHWIFLGNVQTTLNLMNLQNGNSVVILPATAVTPATYTQFRITWATVTYPSAGGWPGFALPINGTAQQMSMPLTTVVNGTVVVAANASSNAQIMLSGQQAVANRLVGINATYTFQATGNAYDLSTTARITGQVTNGSTPLAGAEVFAETVDLTGLATIQRRAFTNASGNYALEGLPTGSTYFVVAQPWNYSSAYQAMASTAVNATSATGYTANLAFTGPLPPSYDLTVIITPPSTLVQSTWAELRQLLPTGSAGSKTLLVRSQSADTGQYQDGTDFFGLFPGTYGVTAQRSTSGATPLMKVGTQIPVSTGGSATTTLTYP